jgi:mono/diheme cytochrome c family protein
MPTRSNVKTFRFAIAMCSVFFAFTITSAQTPPSDASLAANPVFEKNCAKCHGKTANGRMMRGPSLMTVKAAMASTDDLRNIIANGKGHMPKFASQLTPEEIDTLVQQIRTLNGK